MWVWKELLPHVCDELVVEPGLSGEFCGSLAGAGTCLLECCDAHAQTLQLFGLALCALPEFGILAAFLVDELLKCGFLGLEGRARLALALAPDFVRVEAKLVVCAGELAFEFGDAGLFGFEGGSGEFELFSASAPVGVVGEVLEAFCAGLALEDAEEFQLVVLKFVELRGLFAQSFHELCVFVLLLQQGGSELAFFVSECVLALFGRGGQFLQLRV